MKTFTILAIGLALAATAVMAKPPLREVSAVSEQLITAGMAIELDEKCPSVSVRLLRGMSFLNGIASTARDLGYSDAEIDAYSDNDAEQARLEAIARSRLSDMGVRSGDSASYCAVAQAQIDAGTQLGRLLR